MKKFVIVLETGDYVQKGYPRIGSGSSTMGMTCRLELARTFACRSAAEALIEPIREYFGLKSSVFSEEFMKTNQAGKTREYGRQL